MLTATLPTSAAKAPVGHLARAKDDDYMPWPLSQDYNEAVQNPGLAFSDPELRAGEAVVNALGLPIPRSGNFADVYEFRCPGGARYAVKCFTREVPGRHDRYGAISSHLKKADLPFTVDFHYLDEGIRVAGRWYPVLKMTWVEGLVLNEFVRSSLDRPAVLEALGPIWVRLARRLRDARLAHGDLQHGNVILVPGSKTSSLAVKLIDYDGLWVPALASTPSGEIGHPCYQHPQRLREGTYGPEVDRFPLLVVLTALRALAVGGRSLWQRHDTGDNLLFRESDFQATERSALFRELWQLTDPTARALAGHLALACRGRLEDAPLIDDLLTSPALTPAQEAAAATLLSGPAAMGPVSTPASSVRGTRPSRQTSGPAPAASSEPAAADLDFTGGTVALRPRPARSGLSRRLLAGLAGLAGGVVLAVAAGGLALALRGPDSPPSRPAAPTEPAARLDPAAAKAPRKTPPPTEKSFPLPSLPIPVVPDPNKAPREPPQVKLPPDVPTDGLVLWLTSEAGLCQDVEAARKAAADGDPVALWRDQSGRGHDVRQTEDSQRPTLRLAVQNGRPVLRFDGVDDFLMSSRWDRPIERPTVFLTWALPAQQGQRYLFDSGAGDVVQFNRHTINGQRMTSACAGTNVRAAEPDPLSFRVSTVVYDGDRTRVFRDGALFAGPGPAGSNAMPDLRLGAYAGKNGAFNAALDLGELLLYGRPLAEADLRRVETYLRRRWATP